MAASTLPVPNSRIVGRLASGDLGALTVDETWGLLGTNTSSIIINDSGLAVDFTVESDGSDKMFVVDGTNNIVGISSTGLLPDLGTGLHIKNSDTGASVNADANELVVEHTRAGISILSDPTNIGSLIFGSSADNDAGRFDYDHSGNLLKATVQGVEVWRASSISLVVNEAGSAVDFRVEGDTSTHLLFCDASANRAGVSLSGNLVTDGLFHIASGTAGAITAPTDADELVVESAVDGGISVLSGGIAKIDLQGYAGTGTFSIQSGVSAVNLSRLAIGGNPYLDFSSGTGIIFNENGNAYDARFEGDTLDDLLVTDGSADQVHIGGQTAITSGKGVLTFENQTSPTAVLANGIALGSKDSGAGTNLAVPELWIEEPPEAIGIFTPTMKMKIWVNGVEYFIQLDPV